MERALLIKVPITSIKLIANALFRWLSPLYQEMLFLSVCYYQVSRLSDVIRINGNAWMHLKKSLNLKIISLYCNCHNSPTYLFFYKKKLFCTLRQFLIARSIQMENGGFSTECKNLLYLLDMSSKVYKMNFWDVHTLLYLNTLKYWTLEVMHGVKNPYNT